ncbi:MAG: hypothetical protein LBQ34_03165 [Alphaproteobacteria bacterium]|jgi:hypothetical protein|nr:hypothetical protein [Alphaproteobacteria bacterium]
MLLNIKNNKFLYSSLLVSAIYFIFMIKFYLLNYYVPDYLLYVSFGLNNLPSKDSFSSLFIKIVQYGTIKEYAIFLHIFSLFSLTLTIFSFLYFFYKVYQPNFKTFCVAILGVVSCGVWYYIYGKLVYDFPFSAISYAFCLIFLSKWITTKSVEYFCLIFLCLGFLLSWKLYNVFLVVGFIGIIAVSEITKSLFWGAIKNKKYLLTIITLFILGYILGNYHLIDRTLATIKGLRGYPAHYSFYEFFFVNNRPVWDHVNLLGFHYSIFLVPIVLFIMFIMPILLKQKLHLITSLFITIALYVFITNYSPGYTWHGFPLALYVLTLFLVLLGSLKNFNAKIHNIYLIIFVIIFAIQAVSTFGFYIPQQVKWHNNTLRIEKILENNSVLIHQEIKKIIIKYNLKDDYKITTTLKRYNFKSGFSIYSPIFYDEVWNTSDLKNSYYSFKPEHNVITVSTLLEGQKILSDAIIEYKDDNIIITYRK